MGMGLLNSEHVKAPLMMAHTSWPLCCEAVVSGIKASIQAVTSVCADKCLHVQVSSRSFLNSGSRSAFKGWVPITVTSWLQPGVSGTVWRVLAKGRTSPDFGDGRPRALTSHSSSPLCDFRKWNPLKKLFTACFRLKQLAWHGSV